MVGSDDRRRRLLCRAGARKADGPLVELANRERAGRDPGRAGDRRAGDRHRLVAGDARARPGPVPPRQVSSSTCARRDMRDLALDQPAGLIYCPFRALLHLPTWPDRGAPSSASRPRSARRAVRLERLCVRPPDRRPPRRRHQDEPVPHTNRYSVGDNRIDITLDNGAKSSLWWATKNEWLGLLDVAGLELETLYGGFARGAVHRRKPGVHVRRSPAGHRQHALTPTTPRDRTKASAWPHRSDIPDRLLLAEGPDTKRPIGGYRASRRLTANRGA